MRVVSDKPHIIISSTEKQSQSLQVDPSKELENQNVTEFELKLDNYSSINGCVTDQPKSQIIDPTKTKVSYYVRDQFQPMQSHQDNIEKLFIQFFEHQATF